MGEVWKARDTRLDRTVAIKIFAARFSAPFEREAHPIAALNHPNICQLYDVGPDYLVIEYVDGVPLKGPLPAEKAIDHAGQRYANSLKDNERSGTAAGFAARIGVIPSQTSFPYSRPVASR
jgi:serine/threonine protein kinase